MLQIFLCWFVFFLKFEDAQFKASKEYSHIATLPLNCITNGSLISVPFNSTEKYKGHIPMYTILNATKTTVNGFKIGSDQRRRHHKNRAYSDWSDWSSCSGTCITIRQRHCVRRKICGSNIVTESSYCFTRDSRCPEPTLNYKRPSWSVSKKGNQQSFTSSTCGVTDDSSTAPVFKTPRYLLRIMGGQESEKFRWPWQVAVLNGLKDLICGGTLIAPGWVLTAAHCSRKKLFVRLREYDLSIAEGDEIEIRVERVFIHPRYNPNTIDNDMVLLKLHTMDLKMNKGYYIRPACLPFSNYQRSKRKPKMCVVIGWGKVWSKDSYGSDVLREARVPIVGQQTCQAAYRQYMITDNMFCAGYRDGRSDTCSGDSGGPLLCQMRGRWTVVGVTSFGDGCGRRGKYGIYASVANHVPWIESVITTTSRRL